MLRDRNWPKQLFECLRVPTPGLARYSYTCLGTAQISRQEIFVPWQYYFQINIHIYIKWVIPTRLIA